jgi:hypothetical protein
METLSSRLSTTYQTRWPQQGAQASCTSAFMLCFLVIWIDDGGMKCKGPNMIMSLLLISNLWISSFLKHKVLKKELGLIWQEQN